MKIKNFYDSATNTLTYLIYDLVTKDGILIDPVLDYEEATGKISDQSVLVVVRFIQEEGIRLHALLETHAHADHLTGSQLIKKYFPQALIGIGEKIREVQKVFKNHFNLHELDTDGRQFDFLFSDFEEKKFGTLTVKAIPTPGHTPADLSYLIGDNLFTGDSLFMPDYGTGRCDFPKGSARDLYHSVTKNLYRLPDDTKVYVGHDYQPGNRELRFQTSIGESKRTNIQLRENTTEEEFIRFRETRDSTLSAPKLLLPSIQVNIAAGRLPSPEDNGRSYLKIPLSITSKERP